MFREKDYLPKIWNWNLFFKKQLTSKAFSLGATFWQVGFMMCTNNPKIDKIKQVLTHLAQNPLIHDT